MCCGCGDCGWPLWGGWWIVCGGGVCVQRGGEGGLWCADGGWVCGWCCGLIRGVDGGWVSCGGQCGGGGVWVGWGGIAGGGRGGRWVVRVSVGVGGHMGCGGEGG